jgi:hypothetical protein
MGEDRQNSAAKAAIIWWGKALILCGAGLVTLQLIADYLVRYLGYFREPPSQPIGLAVLVVGALMLAYAEYRSAAKPRMHEPKSD